MPVQGKTNLIQDLDNLNNALQTNSSEVIQDLLEKFDEHMNHLVKTRARVGAVLNSIANSVNHTEREIIDTENYRSKLEDVDVAELASDLQRQQTVLNATYKTSSQLMQNTLLDFLR